MSDDFMAGEVWTAGRDTMENVQAYFSGAPTDSKIFSRMICVVEGKS